MLGIDNFGKKSLQEINEFLLGQGLRFGIQFEEGEDGSLWWATEQPSGSGGDILDAGDDQTETDSERE